MEKEYYHLCSKGLERNLIFNNVEDFISGVNDIAISCLKYDIRVLCHCLMSNHFHFILEGRKEECLRFGTEYKRRCAMRMRAYSEEVKGLKDVELSLEAILDQEYLENAVAYVLRNPLAARYLAMPHHYPWSSCNAYFRGNNKPEGTCLNMLSLRKRRELLKSKVEVPENYMIDNHGMIMPECFIDFRQVEEIFRHPSRLMILLAKKIEADVEIRMGISNQASLDDLELKSMMNRLIHEEFKEDSIVRLTMNQKIKLCVMLKRNFGATAKQISRITRLGLDIVTRVI